MGGLREQEMPVHFFSLIKQIWKSLSRAHTSKLFKDKTKKIWDYWGDWRHGWAAFLGARLHFAVVVSPRDAVLYSSSSSSKYITWDISKLNSKQQENNTLVGALISTNYNGILFLKSQTCAAISCHLLPDVRTNANVSVTGCWHASTFGRKADNLRITVLYYSTHISLFNEQNKKKIHGGEFCSGFFFVLYWFMDVNLDEYIKGTCQTMFYCC